MAGGNGLSTPQWLRVGAGLVVVLAVALGLVVGLAAGALRTGFDELGAHAAPQVAASTDLYVALADMDAQVANVLLVGADAGLSDNRQNALTVYGRARSRADGDLQQAAALGGGDPIVARLVHAILDRSGQYQTLAGEALYLNQTGGDPAGRPSATELDIYRQASTVMGGALRDTDSLIAANQAALDGAYADDRSAATVGQIWVIVVCLVLAIVLVGLQIRLRRRWRRRVNPAIAAATLLVIAAGIVVPVILGTADGQFRVAKQDGFDSIIALSRARAVSQEAAANESRFLVDPASASGYQDAFQRESQSVIALSGAGIDRYDAALRAALDAYNVDYSDVRFGGLLAVETGDVLSTSERYGAIRVMARFAGFEVADRQMRATLAAGDLRDAIEFDTGTSLGYSTYDLGRYDQALVGLIGIKQRELDSAVRSGGDAVDGWTAAFPAVLAALVVALTWVGVRPRLREYRS